MRGDPGGAGARGSPRGDTTPRAAGPPGESSAIPLLPGTSVPPRRRAAPDPPPSTRRAARGCRRPRPRQRPSRRPPAPSPAGSGAGAALLPARSGRPPASPGAARTPAALPPHLPRHREEDLGQDLSALLTELDGPVRGLESSRRVPGLQRDRSLEERHQLLGDHRRVLRRSLPRLRRARSPGSVLLGTHPGEIRSVRMMNEPGPGEAAGGSPWLRITLGGKRRSVLCTLEQGVSCRSPMILLWILYRIDIVTA